MLATLLQNDTTNNAAAGGAIGVLVIIYLAIFVVFLVGYWKVFTKLGLPGWMGIIPFVNIYMLFKARGKHEPVVWLILSLIPCINIVAAWMLANDTAELFGKELEIKFEARNIFGTKYKELQQNGDNTIYYNLYKTGTTFSLGGSLKF